jgi:competence protein ComGC
MKMNPHKSKHLYTISVGQGFSLVEAVIALGVLGVVLTFTLPSLFDNMTEVFYTRQYESKFALLRSKVQTGFNAAVTERDINDLEMDLIMNRAGFNYVENKNTGTINHAAVWEDGSVHIPATVETHNLGPGTADKHMYLLPFGGKILTLGYTFGDVQATCGTNDNIALRMIYDSDGFASDHTRINEEGTTNDSIYLYLYPDGSLRTLETVKPGTCTRERTNVTPYDIYGSIT